ncbi:thaumatin type pathogenesis-related group 5 protein [Exidia glandulosa HHB12029]|uniref:Thaumatin type pathogenesis-related group 5 protein n=1 Tax=Exidia glandulosa HHB12029 TaxID=1314781 RepID=A0A165EUP5_EXIGL|nr:thaumatin type pathogenesis-related group 5 protein [Exidia glandulosa HHB12029]
MQLTVLISLAALALTATADRTITVRNKCKQTIWPAIFTPPGFPAPKVDTGFKLAPGGHKSFKVPGNWTSGRIWGRTGCDFGKKVPGPLQCETGGCNGGLKCAKQGGTGVPPATLAEWTLKPGNVPDWYDVSLVDGFNLPMRIDATQGCHAAGCGANLNTHCPAKLQKKNGKGKVVGCLSSCVATGLEKNCCSGSHNTPQTCPKSKVDYYSYFKKGCPNSYVYAYAALWTCAKPADYTLTFCP